MILWARPSGHIPPEKIVEKVLEEAFFMSGETKRIKQLSKRGKDQ
jgi:hypothetical protein